MTGSGRAVVLGGGGVTGIGWEAGVLAGLRRAGVDLGGADRVIGTSAGAFVGALFAGTVPTGGSDVDAVVERVSSADLASDLPSVDFGLVAQAFGIMADRSIDPATARARVGELALSADAGDPAEHVRWFAAHLPRRWPAGLVVTAVAASSGEPVVWDADSGVDLARAIAASCAVPCVFAPVPIDGTPYMDGGVRSVTNADLAAGASAVVVVAPTVGVFGGPPGAELRALGPARHVLISPDEASRDALGDNVLDDSRRPLALAAGLAQGAAAAATVARVWGMTERSEVIIAEAGT
ncbi:MAG TPA: patatin-like phospholipase family protein [Asanoa sp.]